MPGAPGPLIEGDDLVHVVGVSHYQPALLAASGAEPGKEVRFAVEVELVPEPDNPHDPNAVAIKIAGEPVGYLSRDDARRWQPVLLPLAEHGHVARAEAMIAGRGAGSGTENLGVFLRLPTRTEARAVVGNHLRRLDLSSE
jgi:hypothetical protein